MFLRNVGKIVPDCMSWGQLDQRSRYSCQVMGWTVRSSNPIRGKSFFLFSETPRTTYSVGTWVKRPGRQANRLMPRLIMYGAVPLLSLCGVDREKHTFTFPAECLTYHKYVLRMRFLEIFVAALICRHISMQLSRQRHVNLRFVRGHIRSVKSEVLQNVETEEAWNRIGL